MSEENEVNIPYRNTDHDGDADSIFDDYSVLFDELGINERIELVMSLKDGWINKKEGRRPSQLAKELTENILVGLYESGSFEEGQKPGIFPLPGDGGLGLEWQKGNEDWFVEIGNEGNVEISVYNFPQKRSLIDNPL